MKEIIFDNVVKSYDRQIVLDHLNFKVESGERVILLGPSGCGKTTTLRIIAGLEMVTQGSLMMGGRKVNHVPIEERNISMVFQNYALYPHMTVKKNICYGLQVQKIPFAEIERRFREVMEILSLKGLEDRKPRELSGGQRQRVALARAIVKNADYFLLDEPLSNLDAQLRLQARQELVKLHDQFKMTFVYVTHDQVEAMTMGQKIILLDGGKIQMIGTPKEVYHNPANVFTARFIGSPSMNIIPVTFTEGNLQVEGGYGIIPLDDHLRQMIRRHGKQKLYLGIRPEKLQISPQKEEGAVEVKIHYVEDYGHKTGMYFSLGEGDYIAVKTAANVREKQTAYITFPPESVVLFDRESEQNITKDLLHLSNERKALKSEEVVL